MTAGDKIAKLRKEQNLTQEQFAQNMEVSRQSVSKWESGVAFPETEKLIRMSELFGCTIDYLLKDKESEQVSGAGGELPLYQRIRLFNFEYKSKRELFGLPLVHISSDWKRPAKGVFALGFKAKGLISVGLFSMGLLSFGVGSLGILSIGAFSLGLLALGSIAVGLVAIGAVAIGILALGALACGMVADGAVAIGHFLAIGDFAKGPIALGGKAAEGTLYEYASGISGQIFGYDKEQVLKLLVQQMTGLWEGLRKIAEFLV